MNYNSVENRNWISTERIHPKSLELDILPTIDIVKLFSEEDVIPQQAISKSITTIAVAIDSIAERLKKGGKLFYIGAGTSGRLGVLDASELPPTFCTSPDLVQGIIAGGDNSLRKSSEGLEDAKSLALIDLKKRGFSSQDCLLGITAGGTTSYVISALKYSRVIKALTISMSCVPTSEVSIDSDIDIRLVTGPELLSGSTRLKAGTATKMALNIISTTLMIRLGKVYKNQMVDVSVLNNKLLDRALRILQNTASICREDAIDLLRITNGSVKLALLISLSGISLEEAKALLIECDGNLRSSLQKIS